MAVLISGLCYTTTTLFVMQSIDLNLKNIIIVTNKFFLKRKIQKDLLFKNIICYKIRRIRLLSNEINIEKKAVIRYTKNAWRGISPLCRGVYCMTIFI